MAIPDMLKSCPLFFELYDKEIEKMVRYCSVYTFDSGDKIVEDGEIGDQIFVVLEGIAYVEKQLPRGRIRIQPLKAGDVFGELALMGEKTRTADIVADELTYVLEIKYEDIFILFKKEPRIFGLLLLNISRLISHRLAKSNKIIVDLQEKLDKRQAI